MDAGARAERYLATTSSTVPEELRPFFNSFKDLHKKRQWHQLTNALFEFISRPSSHPYQIALFQEFVSTFERNLNPKRFAELAVAVSKQLDDGTRLTFLNELTTRVNNFKRPEANVLHLSAIANTKLTLGDLTGAQADLEAASTLLVDVSSLENTVHAAYYSVSVEFYKQKGDYTQHYKNSLRYLACIDLEKDLTSQQRLILAHDLAISALLSETIYSFGELLMHPILEALENTAHDWIKQLLITFNEGNFGKLDALSPLFAKEPDLQQNWSFLRQKICLSALIETLSKRVGNRALPFDTIAKETQLPINEVEHLVMKAFSLNLIRGTIDQVDQQVVVSWVQPRVLSRTQVGDLASRLTLWMNGLKKVEDLAKSGPAV